MCRRDMDDTWEQQLVCYSLLKDNGTVNGIVIVMGRRKKRRRPLSIIAYLIQFKFLYQGCEWNFLGRLSLK